MGYRSLVFTLINEGEGESESEGEGGGGTSPRRSSVAGGRGRARPQVRCLYHGIKGYQGISDFTAASTSTSALVGAR